VCELTLLLSRWKWETKKRKSWIEFGKLKRKEKPRCSFRRCLREQSLGVECEGLLKSVLTLSMSTQYLLSSFHLNTRISGGLDVSVSLEESSEMLDEASS
jgi:hypothetical protein